MTEEQAYAVALKELTSGKMDEGCWAKAIAFSNGSETTAKANYLQFRGESIAREWRAQDEHRGVQRRRRDELVRESKNHEGIDGTVTWIGVASVSVLIWRLVFVGVGWNDPLLWFSALGTIVTVVLSDKLNDAEKSRKAELKKIEEEMRKSDSVANRDQTAAPNE